MQLAREQFALIEHLLPVKRGNVSIDNLTLLNAILYVAVNGCTWRGLPAEYGRWHTVYTRHEPLGEGRHPRQGLRGAADAATPTCQDRGRQPRQHQHQGSSGRDRGPENGGPQSIGRSRGGLNTKIHLAASSLKQVLGFCLSPGQAHDAPVGRKLLKDPGIDNLQIPLIMDRAYEGNETRYLVQSLGFEPAVPPLQTRRDPWAYDNELNKRRNEIERLFGRIKRIRRVFTRNDDTGMMFNAFVSVAFIDDQQR